MILPNKYVCIDIETTDLDPEKGDVIQLGAVILMEDVSSDYSFLETMAPTSPHRDPKAMEINKIFEEMLSVYSKDPGVVLDHFERWARSRTGMQTPMLAAWGTTFDVSFLKAYYKKIGREWIFSYKTLDLKTIVVWELAKRNKTISGGVEDILKDMGLEFIGVPHNALDDITNTLRIIQKL